jgi:tRNA (guanine-N7-)-methyltransferase
MRWRGKKKLPLEALQPFIMAMPSPAQPATWDGSLLFGNDQPLEVEIGCGKGGFIAGRAAQVRHHNFLGIEIDRGLQLYVASRLARRGLHHARVVHGDARLLLQVILRPACVFQLHIYCPDPWWKRRHRKRRLFDPIFVQACYRVLVPGGKLHLASDVDEYFQIMTDLVRVCTPLREIPEEVTSLMAEIGPTNFERKGLAQGHTLHRASFIREEACSTQAY